MANNDLIQAGNIDLHKRPVVKNSDGSISTVKSMSFNEDGQEILIPTVRTDGKMMSDDEAIDFYHVSGQHLGKFKTVSAADAYANQLHNEQEKEYVKPEFAKSRTDGPNTTTSTNTISFNSGPGNVSAQTQDISFQGIPTRLANNMAVNVGEDEVAQIPTYTSKAIESLLGDMKGSSRQQLMTPVTDVAQAVTLQRVAQANGASYAETVHNGQTHAVLTPGKTTALNSTADAFKSADAIGKGYNPQEVQGFLVKQGYDEANAANIIAKSDKIVQARKAGYKDEEISDFLGQTETKVAGVQKIPATVNDVPGWEASSMNAVETPKLQTEPGMIEKFRNYVNNDPTMKKLAYYNVVNKDEMSAEELLTNLQVLSPSLASMTTRTAGFFGNQESAVKAETALGASRAKIVQMAEKKGLKLEWSDEAGSFVANTPNGQVPINDSTWDSLASQSNELMGGVAGGVAGARVGASMGPWGAFAGSVIGAAGGSALGSQMDYMYSAIKLQEDMEAHVMGNKALTAAEMSVAGDILGFGVMKAGGATIKGLKRVKDLLVDGNSSGAYKALKEMQFVSDDQATQLISQLERVSGNAGLDSSKTFEEKAITAAGVTLPGAEGVVQAAASFNPRAGAAVGRAIDLRAKDLLKTTGEASGEDLGRILREDLSNYVTDVKNQFGKVKAEAAQSPRAANFAFNYDEIAIDPVLNKLQANIMDPTVLEKFTLQAQRVRDMADGRSFSDLLDLRQLVNDFRFNKRITKARDFDTLNGVINNIDEQIKVGARATMENPQKWLTDYATARTDYAKMKGVEENVMYKAMTRPGINEEDIARNLARYIPALDGTFTDLVAKLPSQMKVRVENSVVDTLANKYTAGVGEGARAVNFPLLSKELNGVALTTPVARQMKAAINELSEVFKNDVPLSTLVGTVQVPKFQSYLTTDPVARIKYEVASNVFNYVKTLVPNKQQNTLALVRKTSKLLENPLHAKSMKDLMEEAAGKVDIAPELLKLQQEAARAASQGKDVMMPRVKLYGNGSVLSARPADPADVAANTIPLHRIATAKDVAQLAAQNGINPSATKVIDDMLSQYGYKAVQQGTNKVRVLKGQ